MATKKESINWLEIAIDLFGTQAAAARALHVPAADVSRWLRLKTGVRGIPYKHVELLSDLTGIPIRQRSSIASLRVPGCGFFGTFATSERYDFKEEIVVYSQSQRHNRYGGMPDPTCPQEAHTL